MIFVKFAKFAKLGHFPQKKNKNKIFFNLYRMETIDPSTFQGISNMPTNEVGMMMINELNLHNSNSLYQYSTIVKIGNDNGLSQQQIQDVYNFVEDYTHKHNTIRDILSEM